MLRSSVFRSLGKFSISRGQKTEAVVIVASIEQAGVRGRGECTPYARYGETVDNVRAQIESARAAIEAGADRGALQALLPPGAARNALDCALWDLGREEQRRARAFARGTAGAGGGDDGLHHFGWQPGRNGGGGGARRVGGLC